MMSDDYKGMAIGPTGAEHPSEETEMDASATGAPFFGGTKVHIVNFDRYKIEVELSETGEFRGIRSVGLRKSFIDAYAYGQLDSYDDVDKYYPEG